MHIVSFSVRSAPPYEVEESSFTSINATVVIYIKTRPGCIKQMEVKYNIDFKNHKERMGHSKRVYHDFVNPSDELKKCILMCGGKEMTTTGVLSAPVRPLVPLNINRHSSEPVKKQNSYISHVDFSQIFKDSMTDSETELLSKLYLAQSCYERQSDASIVLPPMTDPIYQLPELPMSITRMLQ